MKIEIRDDNENIIAVVEFEALENLPSAIMYACGAVGYVVRRLDFDYPPNPKSLAYGKIEQ